MSLFKSKYYYHQSTKAFIIAFGSLFDNMSLRRYDATGTPVQDYIVPINFAPKNKWVSMIKERPDFTSKQVQITLPRMAFEIVKFNPAPERKLGFNGTYSVGNLNSGGRTKIMNPTPYDLTVALYAAAKDGDDMLQIIEQVLPYFNPSLTMNFNILPEFGVYKDVPVTLNSVDTNDNFDSSVDEQRLIVSTFMFTAQMVYFGPVSDERHVIKDVKIDIGDFDSSHLFENYEARVNPITASETDPHTIVETWNR